MIRINGVSRSLRHFSPPLLYVLSSGMARKCKKIHGRKPTDTGSMRSLRGALHRFQLIGSVGGWAQSSVPDPASQSGAPAAARRDQNPGSVWPSAVVLAALVHVPLFWLPAQFSAGPNTFLGSSVAE